MFVRGASSAFLSMRGTRIELQSNGHVDPNLVPMTEDGKILVQIPSLANNEEHKYDQPSRVALSMHRRACLIWNMAGGADPTDLDSEDDDYEEQIIDAWEWKDPASIRKWIEESAATLNIGEDQVIN